MVELVQWFLRNSSYGWPSACRYRRQESSQHCWCLGFQYFRHGLEEHQGRKHCNCFQQMRLKRWRIRHNRILQRSKRVSIVYYATWPHWRWRVSYSYPHWHSWSQNERPIIIGRTNATPQRNKIRPLRFCQKKDYLSHLIRKGGKNIIRTDWGKDYGRVDTSGVQRWTGSL